MKKENVANKIKNNGVFAGFANVARHFFPRLAEWLGGMDDPRHASYIKHSQGVLRGSLVMKDICGLESMQAMNKTFMTDEARGALPFSLATAGTPGCRLAAKRQTTGARASIRTSRRGCSRSA